MSCLMAGKCQKPGCDHECGPHNGEGLSLVVVKKKYMKQKYYCPECYYMEMYGVKT